MQIFTICPPPYAQRRLKKLLIIMKLTTLLMIIGCIHVSAAGYSQKINLSERNVSLNSVFSKMEKQSGYHFFSNSEFIAALPNVSVSIKNATLSEALNEILSKVSLSYSIVDKTVVITPLSETVNGIKKAVPTLIIGAVLDEQGKPIPGANVKVKGTIQRTITDQDGKFKILVIDADAILQISYVGYQNKEVSIKDLKNPFIIKLYAVSGDLDQVQVIAYGTTTKRLNPGSTFTIKADELAKSPVPNVLQMIQNRVPGLSIVQQTGQPGGAFTVRIRGINGFNNVDPLYVVDGVAFPAGGVNGNIANSSGGLPLLNGIDGRQPLGGGNALNYLNPDDIESIDVLKDADATAIYGSRGAYGVILITTKKAKGGKPSLNVTVNTGLSQRGTSPQLLGTADYLMLRREALKNDGLQPSALDVDINGTYPENRYTDWGKELIGNLASTTRLNTTYSGGSGNTNFLIGASYNNQDNIQKNIGNNRDGGMRFNVNNTTPDKKFSIDFSGSFNSTVNTMLPLNLTAGSILAPSPLLLAPNGPSLLLPDGSLNWETGANVASGLVTTYRSVTNNLLSSTALSYTPVKGLTIRTVIGYNLLQGSELRTVPTTYFSPLSTNAAQLSNSDINKYDIRTWTIDPNINYVTKAGAKGTLKLTAGATLQDKLLNTSTISGTNFISDALLMNPSSAATVTANYNRSVTRYMGYFGIAEYNWSDKYIVKVNSRYDGSTKFGPGNRYGFFGSGALEYIFSEEKWIKENLQFLSFGKLKASYGTVGGDGIANYQYLPSYTVATTYQGKSAISASSLSNPDLHWEKNKKRDIGLSLGFLKDRIIFDADYYRNTTTDQLVQQPLSAVTGFSTITLNTPAVIQNTGYEFSMVSHNIQGKNFSWTTSANLTLPNSKLLSFPPNLVQPNSAAVVGLPITNVRLFQYAGVDPQTGLYNFINAAGVKGPFTLTGNLNQITDKTVNYNVATKFYGSFSNTFTYKSFSLDFTFSLVNKTGLNYAGQQYLLPGRLNANTTTWALDRWQKPGDITDVPKATTNIFNSLFGAQNFSTSTGAYERIIFSKLQNLSLSYSLPNTLVKKAGISSMRVVLQGQNLLTISKYGDLDPENLNFNSIPPLRIFSLGINLTF